MGRRTMVLDEILGLSKRLALDNADATGYSPSKLRGAGRGRSPAGVFTRLHGEEIKDVLSSCLSRV